MFFNFSFILLLVWHFKNLYPNSLIHSLNVSNLLFNQFIVFILIYWLYFFISKCYIWFFSKVASSYLLHLIFSLMFFKFLYYISDYFNSFSLRFINTIEENNPGNRMRSSDFRLRTCLRFILLNIDFTFDIWNIFLILIVMWE